MSNSIPTVFERELSTDMIDPNLDFRMPNESDVVMNRRTVKISPQSGGGDARHRIDPARITKLTIVS